MKRKSLISKISLLLSGVMIVFSGCTMQDDLDALTGRVDALEGKVSTIGEQIENLKTVTADLDAFDKTLNDEVQNLKKADSIIEEKIAELKGVDAQLANDIETISQLANSNYAEIETLKAKLAEQTSALEALTVTVGENTEATIANKNAIQEIETTLAEIEANLTALETQINNLDEIFATDSDLSNLESQLGDLDSEVGNLDSELGDLETEVGNLDTEVGNLDSELGDLETEVGNLDTEVGNLDSELGDLDTEMTEEFAAVRKEMAEAIAAAKVEYETALATLRGEISEMETRISKTLGEEFATALEGYAKLEEYRATAEALETLREEYDATAEKVETLGGDITKINAKFDELETVLNSKATKEDLAKTKEEYTAAIDAALKDALANDSKISDDIKSSINTAVANLNNKIAELETALNNLKNDYTELLNRIQSVVFVPQHVDGKATIKYAMVGSQIIETQSVLKFQVYPYDAAVALNIKHLTFNMSDALQTTRANEAPALNITKVEVANKEKGIINIYVNTRNFSTDFYEGNEHFATSLSINNGSADIASNYVTLAPISETNAEKIEVAIKNATAEGHKIQYTDLETVKEILPKHELVFSTDGKKWLNLKEMTELGYAISYEQTITSKVADSSKPNVFTVSKMNRENIEGQYVTVKLNKEDAKAVGQQLIVAYTYNVADTKVTVEETVDVTRITGNIAMSIEDIKWAYNFDAASDAGNEATLRIAKATIESTGTNLPKGTEYKDVIATTPTKTTIKSEGVVVSDVTAVFGGSNDEPTVTMTGFEWNKEYTIEAYYELSNVDVVITASVKTIDRSRNPITIALKDESFKLMYQLEFETELESIETILESVKDDLGTTTLAEYLKDNFITKLADATVANTFNGTTATATTGMFVNAEGNKVNVKYSYNDFSKTPDAIEYVYTITTWYGQQITITKKVNIELPLYDFMHNDYLVKWNSIDDCYSRVNPKYLPGIDQPINNFSVDDVDLNRAFNVVDENGETIKDLAAANLIVKFTTTSNCVISDDNKLSYNVKNDHVSVSGHLYLNTGIAGEQFALPTKFDANGDYSNYVVKKYDPINVLLAETHLIELSEAGTYTSNTWDGLSIKDYRSGKYSYDLIKDGAWVVGNDANGFASGKNVADIYGMEINFKLESTPENLVDFIEFNETTGTLVFKHTSQLQLEKPVDLKVKVTITYPQGVKEATRIVTIYTK